MPPYSSSSVESRWSDQVFISYRGDVRNGFVSHMVKALKYAGINVYTDEHETRGEDLTTLFSRIKESKIALVVFSSTYTGSRWCLDELEKINECLELGTLVAIPIFYQIETTDVKRLEGAFGEQFNISADRYGKGDKWREAIAGVSKKFAIVVNNTRKESEIVDEIVREVIKVLTREIAKPAHDPSLKEQFCYHFSRFSHVPAPRGTLSFYHPDQLPPHIFIEIKEKDSSSRKCVNVLKFVAAKCTPGVNVVLSVE